MERNGEGEKKRREVNFESWESTDFAKDGKEKEGVRGREREREVEGKECAGWRTRERRLGCV